MTTTTAILVFLGSLVLSAMASAVLAERLDQVGERFRFPAGLIGLVTALGADSPEIASAVTALVSGQHDLGRGVIFGSNVFNVAFLLGFSAVLANRVRIGRENLALNGGVALAATLIVGVQATGVLGVAATGALLAAVLVPYLAVSCLRPDRLSRLPLPSGLARWLAAAITSERRDEAADERDDRTVGGGRLTTADALSILPLLSVVVATSIGLVNTAEVLGTRWHVAQVVVGTFVIATLTGLPNLIASARLATKGRGAALSSEAFNSNTLNLLVGAYLPTLFVSLAAPSRDGFVSILWLVGITLAALALGLWRGGFGRSTGGLLLLAYAGFVLSVLL